MLNLTFVFFKLVQNKSQKYAAVITLVPRETFCRVAVYILTAIEIVSGKRRNNKQQDGVIPHQQILFYDKQIKAFNVSPDFCNSLGKKKNTKTFDAIKRNLTTNFLSKHMSCLVYTPKKVISNRCFCSLKAFLLSL